MNKEQIEQLKKLMAQIHKDNVHAMEYDYEGGSMWEAYDTGLMQGKAEVSKIVLEIISAIEN